MKKVAIIRCEKNVERCPLTNCFRCLQEAKMSFAIHDQCSLAGVFTCRCPGEQAVDLAKILKAKGAEAIHFCTCTFAHKKDGEWIEGEGFCDYVDEILQRISKETGIPCVKGTAHLPKGYEPQVYS